MALKELTEAVLEQARQRAREEIDRARAQAEEAVVQARAGAIRKAEERVTRARLQAAREEEMARAASERERRLAVLAEKNRQIDLLFSDLSTRFAALPPVEKDALYRKELSSLDLSRAKVLVPRGRKTAFTPMVPKGTLVQEDPSLSDGFVVEGPSYRIDRTDGMRLREAREELAAEAAALLFPEKEAG